MGYTNYKQQFTFGFKEIDLGATLPFSSSSTKYYLGEAVGAVANLSATTNDSTHTKPIDVKNNGIMFARKAILDIMAFESLAPAGTKQVVTITLSGTAVADGSISVGIVGESSVATLTVDVTDMSTHTDIADALATAINSAFTTWSATASSGVVTLTRKKALANVTVNSTNFDIDKTGLTSLTVGDATSSTAGVTPEADTTHVVKFDICSAKDSTELTAIVGGGTYVPIASLYVTPNMFEAQSEAIQQILMPKNVGQYVWVEMSMPNIASNTQMTAGICMVRFNPNMD